MQVLDGEHVRVPRRRARRLARDGHGRRRSPTRRTRHHQRNSHRPQLDEQRQGHPGHPDAQAGQRDYLGFRLLCVTPNVATSTAFDHMAALLLTGMAAVACRRRAGLPSDRNRPRARERGERLPECCGAASGRMHGDGGDGAADDRQHHRRRGQLRAEPQVRLLLLNLSERVAQLLAQSFCVITHHLLERLQGPL